jgi:hypothetical protein
LINRKTISPQTSREDDRYGDDSPQSRKLSTPGSVGDKPSYMSHTVASLEHVNTSRRDSSDVRRESVGKLSITKATRNMSESTNDSHDNKSPRTPTTPTTPTKFGVELRRVDSGRGFSSSFTTSNRKSSVTTTTTGSELPNIEEIFDVEALEKLLEIVVGYEQRRRIRTQIRLVRKMISEGKLGDNKTTKRSSIHQTERTVTSQVKSHSTAPHTCETVHVTKTVQSKPSSSKLIETSDGGHVRTVTTTTTTKYVTDKSSPQDKKVTQTRTVTQSRLSSDKSPRGIIDAFNKNAPKTRGSDTTSTKTVTKRVTSTSNQKKEVREMPKDIDSVTSPYGIGPTDENGMPLFGLKALRKKAAPVTMESKGEYFEIYLIYMMI